MFWFNNIGFRPVEEGDLEAIRKLRNDPTTYNYLTHIKLINPIEQRNWFEKISRNINEAYYTIVEKPISPEDGEGDFLGIIRMREIDIGNRSIQVGCDIAPGKRRKGYGTATFKAILKYCFDYLAMHRVWLCVVENNEVALKLYKNVGFVEEGVYRKAIFRDGRYWDYVVMSILEDEYRGRDAL